MNPRYDLAEIKKIVQQWLDGAKESIVFNAPSRSIKCVIEVVKCDIGKAEEIIADGLMQLKKEDYSSSFFQWGDAFDIYGLENYLECNWYVKFCIFSGDDGEPKIESVSFHPIEKELTLSDGRTLAPVPNP